MKTSLLSLVAALSLFVTTAAAAAPLAGPHYPSPRERVRSEAAQREQARYLALERAHQADQRRAQQQRTATIKASATAATTTTRPRHRVSKAPSLTVIVLARLTPFRSRGW